MLDLADRLAGAPLIAMVTEPDRPAVPDVVSELGACGIRAVEITLTTPNALDTVRRAVERNATLVGSGTVLTVDLARQAVDAGADYLLTPGVLPDVLEEGQRLGVPVVCGAFTLTEVLDAWRRGAALVKLFPAWLGGPRYVTALTAALPDIPLVPTGGVTLATAPDYTKAGATALALGREIIGDALRDDGDLAAIRGRVDALFAATRPVAP